jgi:hypothetical protein
MKTRYRAPLFITVALLTILLIIHLALPIWVRDYLNDKLADMGDYRGQITDVDLAWWRGAYRINGLQVVKVDGEVPVPFVDAPLIDLAVSWHSLWHDRAVVARVLFQAPEVNFVDGEGSQKQTGEGTDWREQLEKLLPITLDEIRVRDGTVRFRNFNSEPPVNISAKQVNASLYNLTNVKDERGTRVARFEGKAMLLDHAPMEATALFDPFKEFNDFEVRLRATDIDLPQLNDLAAAYGKFDFKAGHGDLVIEAVAENSQVNGYIKPLLRDVDIFDWRQDVENEDKGFFRSIWEAVVGGAQTVLKNQRKNQFATRVELSGSLKQQNISPFQAFIAILRNGFIQAFNSRFEREAPSED